LLSDGNVQKSHKEDRMDLKLKGKTALVTGGSEGIGKGIALLLAKEGVDIAICARRQALLQATADEIAKQTGRKIVAIPADLTKDAEAKNFVEQGHKALGRVDIMINNAGSAPGGVIENLTEADWTQALQLKFMGYVRCLRYVLPIMVKQGGGRDRAGRGERGGPKSHARACRPIWQAQYQFLRGQSRSGAHRALGPPRRNAVARYEYFR
jgi:NAD(P)-dependent dehydrogenase (short-subunit alcohol dehydrogenase family)